MSDPLAGSRWSDAGTIEGFRQSPPNHTLLTFAAAELARGRNSRAIDIGCGAARNAVHLARQGWHVLGTDLSQPMLEAARARADAEQHSERLRFALAPMEALPAPDGAFDLLIAHGIWNLARSTAQFRSAVAEAARVAAPGAGLFVFTFSRHTLPPDVSPLPGEAYVFTQFSGQPQCFVTRNQLIQELEDVGFVLDDTIALSEHNLPAAGTVHAVHTPVIFEAAFRCTRA